jgi:PAS domain S-box-containing protein
MLKIKNIKKIQRTILDYANGNFKRRLDLDGNNQDLDTILVGINMLGEELEHKTISRDYFSNIFDSVSSSLIVFSPKAIITDVNLSAEKTFQKQKKELVGKDLRKIIDFEGVFGKTSMVEIIKTQKEFEVFISTSTGLRIPYLCSISGFIDNHKGHQNYLLKANDISEQKERDIIEKKLVINAIEKERIRLSNDMHDSLGQEINAVRLYLNSIACMDATSDTYKEAIETCKSLLNHSVETVRDICFDLMPKSLEKGGFILACNELIVKLNNICKINYNFPNFELNLSLENQTILYRIIQEFLSNSIKHSNCTKIDFKIEKTKKNVHLYIGDNGKGFDMNIVVKGNGLHNILSRIEVLQVNHNFNSELKKGTSLSLYFEN